MFNHRIGQWYVITYLVLYNGNYYLFKNNPNLLLYFQYVNYLKKELYVIDPMANVKGDLVLSQTGLQMFT